MVSKIEKKETMTESSLRTVFYEVRNIVKRVNHFLMGI